MPRRREVPKRKILPDPIYNDVLVTKFMNCVMLDGKKAIAEKIVYGAFDVIKERTREEPLKIFHKALENCQPMVEVKSRRVGGANYQVPIQVNRRRQQSLTFRWIIAAVREEKGKPAHIRLAKELMDAARGEGKAVQTRENTHRMAEANKAFAHFAW